MRSSFRREHSEGQQEAAERVYERWDLRPESGSHEDRIAGRAFVHGWQARYEPLADHEDVWLPCPKCGRELWVLDAYPLDRDGRRFRFQVTCHACEYRDWVLVDYEAPA